MSPSGPNEELCAVGELGDNGSGVGDGDGAVRESGDYVDEQRLECGVHAFTVCAATDRHGAHAAPAVRGISIMARREPTAEIGGSRVRCASRPKNSPRGVATVSSRPAGVTGVAKQRHNESDGSQMVIVSNSVEFLPNGPVNQIIQSTSRAW